MKLAYHATNVRNVRRQGSLTRDEEQEIADRGREFVSSELYSALLELSSVESVRFRSHSVYKKVNSLIWIYVQMSSDQVRSNIRILMASKELFSVNQLAAALGMNASFLGRLLAMQDATGFGGWNVDTLFQLATVLDARPELLLQGDLLSAMRAEVTNWQLP